MNKVIEMSCVNDPEGGVVLTQYYQNNGERERAHFFDAVIKKHTDDLQKLVSHQCAEEMQYQIEHYKFQIEVLNNLKDCFVKNGIANNTNEYICISAHEKDVIEL